MSGYVIPESMYIKAGRLSEAANRRRLLNLPLKREKATLVRVVTPMSSRCVLLDLPGAVGDAGVGRQ